MKKMLSSVFFAVLAVVLVCMWTSKTAKLEKTSVTANATAENVMSLDGDDWKLSFWVQPDDKAIRTPQEADKIKCKTISAKVPGNVERDLCNAGIIKDIEVGLNSYQSREYEGHQWRYSRSFPSPKLNGGERAILKFGCIDCLADIFVNGKKVGEAKNFFLEYKYDITDVLNNNGQNKLDVIIRSAVIESSKYKYGVLGHFHVNGPDGEYIRKPAHCYGWDIMPRMVSAGLCRSVSVEVQKPVRIEDTYWFVSRLADNHKDLTLGIDIAAQFPFSYIDNVNFQVTLSKDGKEVLKEIVPATSYNVRVRSNLKNPELWWPRGYGAQTLYDAEVAIVDKSGKVLAKNYRKIGLRRVELEYADICPSKNEKGKMLIKVNGTPIFIKGTNWVPVDALHGGDMEKMPAVLEMLTDLNCNMVRIWGGGVYEPKEFFDYCDANGILVWHDFAMGCTTYPQRDDFAKIIEEEAIQAVIRIRNHPSMALWCGNNENDISLEWQLRQLKLDPNKDRLSREVLPRVLFEFDPFRPYLPSSPFISQEVYDNPKVVFPAESHMWNSDQYHKIPYFAKPRAVFTSEIGYHGCPNLESLKKMMSPSCVKPFVDDKGTFNKEWIAKGVNTYQNVANKILCDRPNKFVRNSKSLFGEVFYKDLDKFIFASQAAQAEALKFFVETFRSMKFDKSGILWWNLRDAWPVLSDAVVDYYNSKKLAYYFLKRVQTNELVLVNNDMELIAVNDTLSKKKGSVKVTDIESGKLVFEGAFEIAENGKTKIADLKAPSEKGMFKIEYTFSDAKTKLNHYLYGKAPFNFEKYRKWISFIK